MSLNGSGVYVVNSAGQPVVATTLIDATVFNAFTADIATALSTAIFKDGQQTVTANIPMAGFRFTGLGAGSAAGHSLRWEQVIGVIDAAGDLLVGTAADTMARKAVGTNGFVLRADSTQSDGLAWADLNTNPIINPAMEVWQRGTSFVAAANNDYTADRWLWGTAGAGVVTISRNGATLPTVAQAGVLFNYALDVDVTTSDASIAAGDLYFVQQKIEGYNFRHFAQRAFTVSFWVRDTVTGEHAVAFQNSGANRSYIATYTVNVSNTWEYKTVNVSASPSAGTWDYTNGVGLQVSFTLAAGSTYQTTAGAWQTGNFYGTATTVNSMSSTSNDFIVTGVKMELGSVATPLQFRSWQDEFALCCRYYQKSFKYATAPVQNAGANTNEYNWMAVVAGAATIKGFSYLPVRMRAAATYTLYNPSAANAQARNETTSVDCSATSVSVSEESMANITTTQDAGAAIGNQLGIHWTASAEL